jgi:hypothetical protein
MQSSPTKNATFLYLFPDLDAELGNNRNHVVGFCRSSNTSNQETRCKMEDYPLFKLLVVVVVEIHNSLEFPQSPTLIIIPLQSSAPSLETNVPSSNPVHPA